MRGRRGTFPAGGPGKIGRLRRKSDRWLLACNRAVVVSERGSLRAFYTLFRFCLCTPGAWRIWWVLLVFCFVFFYSELRRLLCFLVMVLSVKVWSARGRGCLGFEEHVNGLRFDCLCCANEESLLDLRFFFFFFFFWRFSCTASFRKKERKKHWRLVDLGSWKANPLGPFPDSAQ